MFSLIYGLDLQEIAMSLSGFNIQNDNLLCNTQNSAISQNYVLRLWKDLFLLAFEGGFSPRSRYKGQKGRDNLGVHRGQ